MCDSSSTSKVFYHPLEAAIRWAGLLRYKREILSVVSSPRHLPDRPDCPRWETLRLCVDRIYDGIVNQELPYGKSGVTLMDESLLDSQDLTIRHVDLKRWMRTHYPEHRPGFLFSRSERIADPIITLEAAQAMLTERQAMTLALEHYRRQLQDLQVQYGELLKQSAMTQDHGEYPMSERAEATYLNIIGGMLILMLGTSPSGKRYSSFSTQEAVINALVAHYGTAMGIAERTLQAKFAQAKRRLHSAVS